MSLSRPVKFPLLKLPWLCINCVLHNSDEFVLILFATISNRTRRIVKNSKYRLKEIDVDPGKGRRISIGTEIFWYFVHDEGVDNGKFALQRGAQPLHTCRGFGSNTSHFLHSYTAGDNLDALRMGIYFMIDVFGCSVGKVFIDRDRLSELFGLGISTVKELFIKYPGPVDMADLNYLLETVNVTDRYVFSVRIPEDFDCDPRIFKCRRLSFLYENSADWVTLEHLCQFDVPQLNFWCHRFSEEDIVSYVTYWFNSENRKLESFFVDFDDLVSLEDFKIDHLNPMPFNEKQRNRCPVVGGWKEKDISSGMDILRKDGLLATFYVDFNSVIFYVWHKRFPDAVQR